MIVKYPYLASFSLRRRLASFCPKLCIVGSGPSAFYTAQILLKKHETVKVDMYEKLPAPFGLVRYGVAPDHPEVKNIIKTFTEVAKNPRFSFFGNVSIGKDISLKDLHKAYSAIVFAYGAAVDKHLNVPGENLPGVLSAKDLVGWYNGTPNRNNFNPDLDCETAVIVGMGNVSIDVARILLSPIDRLKHTDIPEPVISLLSKSRVRRVVIIGRRGPLHVAFTLKEIRELSRLHMMESTEESRSLTTNLLPSDVFQFTIGNDQEIQRVLQGIAKAAV